MVVEYSNSFKKDLASINNAKLARKIWDIIEEVKNANSIIDINNIMKMKGADTAFRIKTGNYRIGIYIEKKTVEFSRFMHRKDIYKYFP